MTADQIVRAHFRQMGHFGSNLYDLWCVADSSNQMIIENAWVHLFRRFNPNFQPRGTT